MHELIARLKIDIGNLERNPNVVLRRVLINHLSEAIMALEEMALEGVDNSPALSVGSKGSPQNQALTGKYGNVLAPFLEYMNAELHANTGKGDRPGWLSMTRPEAMLEIYYHVAKLQKAVEDNNLDLIREYSADVANMAMMMLDICGGIES